MNSMIPSVAAPNVSDLVSGAVAGSRPKPSAQSRLRAQAEDFEVQFVNSMFQEMYAGIGGDGPFGNSQSVGPWRSFLTEEYAKNFVHSGGIGIADQVYQSLLAHQEARAK
jgi:peptidoglycan hydrolase FlgJ